MASTMRRMLQLPSSVRQACFLAERFSGIGRYSFQSSPIRTFTCTKTLSIKPSLKGVKKPVAPLSPSQTSKARSRQPPSSTLSAPPPVNTSAPPPGPLEAEKVLLYTAPKHGGFFAISFFTGALLLWGATEIATIFLKERPDQPKLPWYVKAAEALPTLVMTVMGTVCIFAPMKMIKSMAIVTVEGQRLLRFEIKRPLPFLKPEIAEARFSKVSINNTIRSLSEDIYFTNIPIKQAESFTKDYLSKTLQAKPKRSVTGALSSFNKSLLNAWPSLKKNARRMLLRDGMMYVRIGGNGLFKMDVNDCSLLDYGKPLEQLIRTEPKGRPSIMNSLRTLVGR